MNDEINQENLDINVLKQEIEGIKKRLVPDEIAKAVEHSYLSVNNIRTWLQILAIIMTVFLTGIAVFGFIGIQNILTVQEKIHAMDQLENKVNQLENKVSVIQKNLKDISEMFNRVAITNNELLNAREQQLLILLAREIDPNNPIFSFNAANVASIFGRYDEALKYIEIVIKTPDIPTDIQERAKELKVNVEKAKANPLNYPEINEGPAVGNYSILGLNVNMLKKLVLKGFLSAQDANDIFRESKRKQ